MDPFGDRGKSTIADVLSSARQEVHGSFETSRPFTPRESRSLFDGDDYSSAQRPGSSWSSAVTSQEVHGRLQSRDSSGTASGNSGPAASWGWAASDTRAPQPSSGRPVVAGTRGGRSSRFKTRNAGAAGEAEHEASGAQQADGCDEHGLDAYGQAVLAGVSEPPSSPFDHEQPSAQAAYGADSASIQQQADLMFEQRIAAMQAEDDAAASDASLPPSLLGLSSTLSDLEGGDHIAALARAWRADLPPLDAKLAPVAVQQHEQDGVALCTAMLPQLSTLASAIASATAHAETHSYGQTLADTAQLTIESSLTLRRRLVRQLVQPLDSSSLAARVFLSQCVLAAAAIPGHALQPHADALTSPGKTASPPAGPVADPVRDAAALAARHLFVCSKSSSLDAVFRDSGCLGVLLEVLRMGCDAASSTQGGPSTPQKRSSLPRVAAGAGSVTGHSAPELPAPFHFPACPAHGNELTYLLGVLKNVSHSEENASWLVTQGALSVLVSILEGVTAAATGGGDGGGSASASGAGTAGDAKHMGQVAVQATGALRNLCLMKRHLPQVWSSGAVDALLRVLPRLRRHSELGLNAARILAKLTLHEPARARFVAVPSYVGGLLELVSLAPARAPAALVVRVMFSLGNLTATNEATRQRLGRHPDAVPAISALLQSHSKLLVANLASSAAGTATGSLSKPASEAADVLVKTCRTAAHLAIDGAIAASMSHSDVLGSALATVLDALPSPLPPALTELALNALSVCTNLAFHAVPPPNEGEGGVGCLASHCDVIAPSLVRLMHDPQDDVVVHAVRTAANLCRRAGTRDALAGAAAGGVVSAAVTLLHHRQREAAVTACGVLMNIVLTPAGRQALSLTCLLEEGGGVEGGQSMSAVAVLSRVVEAAYWGGDIEFSTTAGRVLFNHCLGWGSDGVSAPPRMTDDEALGLLAVIDGVLGDASEKLGTTGASDSKGDATANSTAEDTATAACADVLRLLREDVKGMVDAGRVADHEERFRAAEAGSKQ